MILGHVATALPVSAGVTLAALFVFGVVKSRFTGVVPLRGGVQMLVTGGLAATAGFVVARLFGCPSPPEHREWARGMPPDPREGELGEPAMKAGIGERAL